MHIQLCSPDQPCFLGSCFPGLALAAAPCSSEMSESSQNPFSHASVRSQTRSLCRLEGCLRRRPCWAHRMEWRCLLPLNVPACLRLDTRGARLRNNTVAQHRQERHHWACYRWMAPCVVGCLQSCIAEGIAIFAASELTSRQSWCSLHRKSVLHVRISLGYGTFRVRIPLQHKTESKLAMA